MPLKKKVILLSLILSNLVEQPTLEIEIKQGKLRGRISGDGKILEYLGIPYSTANETNRFQAPYPPPSWEGVFDAFDEHYRCPQRFGRKFIIGEEDCLKLNVYRPAQAKGPLPVMVFIHGGGYFENSASPSIYGASYFVRHDVILVTINYRLGALGFLCLGIKGAPGNTGLKDQLAALHWVQDNIGAFGGDPDEVTLFGESAGASSVAFLRLTAHAKGLFKRTIMQSGSSLGAWSVTRDPIDRARKLAKEMGFDVSNPADLLQIYKEASIRQLITTDVPKPNDSIVTSRLLFVPCLEKRIPGIDNVLTQSPYKTLSNGNYVRVPTITGINDREGIFLVGKETVKSLAEKNNSTYLPSNLEFPSEKERYNVFKKVRKLYFGNKAISKETVLNLADLYSDAFFIMPTIFEADLICKTSNEMVYNYVFKYSGYRNIVKYISGFRKEPGASHADELFYMFKSSILPPVFGMDQTIIDRFTSMWTNFAKYGSPTPATTDLLPIHWAPSKPNDLRFLSIDKQMSMGGVPDPERSSFWNETYARFRRKSRLLWFKENAVKLIM